MCCVNSPFLTWSRSSFGLRLVMALVLVLTGESTLLNAQFTNPIASRWANARIEGEEIGFLVQMGQLTPEQQKLRTAAMNTELQAIRTLLNALPREVQMAVAQESERMFAARVIPLREQWKQALAQKRQEDAVVDAQRRKELVADGDVAGKLQAERTLLRERAQRGEVSQTDAARADREAEQQILALHRKYDAYGPAWGRLFTQTEARYTAVAVAAGRLRLRLDDTTSPIGRDAHRAADLTLSIQRNQVFVAQKAMTAQEAQSVNATTQSLLTSLNQKYAGSPDAGDFRDRVTRLVQERAAAERPNWEREAAAARNAAAASAAAAAARPPAERTSVPTDTVAPITAAPASPPNAATLPGPAAQPAPTPELSLDTVAPLDQPAPSGAPRQTNTPAPSRRGGAGQTTVATTVLPLPMPTPTPEESGGIPWTPIVIVLLLVGGTGAGVYVLRNRKAIAPPRYQAPPQIADQPFVSARATRSQDSHQTSPTHGPPPAAAGNLKAQLFDEQREKYQNRYNDVLDEVTAATAALTQMAPLLETTQANLQLLSKGLRARIRAVIAARSGSLPKMLLNAAILLPVWRLFRRGNLLVKIAIGYGLYKLAEFILFHIVEGTLWLAVACAAGAFVVAFFIERHLTLKAPLGVLNRHTREFDGLSLTYVYKGQPVQVQNGQPVYRAVLVRPGGAPQEEWRDDSLGTGTFILTIGQMASYRLDPGGSAALLAASQTHEFMNRYGAYLTEAMNDQGDFAASTLPSFAQYGEALWQKQRAEAEIPRLEALLKDVDRIERLWKDTWVSDEVFEFLFRSIDMFNVRDAAIPPGLLLYGAGHNGKKHLARKVAETISARFEDITPAKISSAEKISALWSANRGGDPVVLFVPNPETVFPKSPDGRSAADTLEWIAEWEKHEPRESRVWVLMTAASDDAVDPAILDHLGRDAKIEIKAPDATGRRLLFEMACRHYQVSGSPPETAIRASGGASVQEIRRIVTVVKRATSLQQPQEKHWIEAIQTVRGRNAKIKDPTKTWDRLVLPQKIKERLQVACKILQDAQEYMKVGAKIENILLYGPPGTGKTEIARTIANEGGVNFMDQKLSDLKGEYQGQSVQNVKRMFESARAMAPTVLFIDEIDGVGQQRGTGDDFTRDIINELLVQMEGAAKSDQPVSILAATNLPDTLDKALLRRFQHKIEIPLPDEDARREIFVRQLREKKLAPDLDPAELAAAVAKRTNGQSGAGLRDVVDRAMTRAVALAMSTQDIQLTRALIMDEVDELAKLSSDKVDPGARWDTLVVSDATLAQLKQVSDALRHMETFQRQGIDPPRGAVLYGPAGTGKTQIAKTLANETDIPFLFKTGADLGTSAREVRAVFDDARSKAPCILFLDEFEKAGQSRDHGGSADVVTELLAQIHGAKKTDRPVFVLAATNYLDRLDKAILSRFTYRIEVPLPTVEQREKLFAVVLAKYPRAAFDVAELSAELARSGGGLSGRDINDVVVRAGQAAVQRALLAGHPEQVVMTRDDLTAEVDRMVKERSDKVDPKARWDTLVLSDETMNTLKQISRAMQNMEDRLKRGLEPPRGAVLFGPPGTGKTQIARTLANESKVQFVSATAKDMKGEYRGESIQKVAKLFADAREKAPCILFLDEFDNATRSRAGHDADPLAAEVVSQLLAEMDGVKATGRPVFVLAATNYLEHVDRAVLSRFTYKVEIPNPTPEQRQRLFEISLRNLPRVDFDIPEMAAELAKRKGEISGREIGDLVRKAGLAAADRAEASDTPDHIVVTRDDLLSLLAPAGQQVTEENLTNVWSQIVLKQEVKESLLGMIRLFNSGSKAAPKGLLLYGPPGTGKTEIGRLLAKSTGSEFLKADVTTLKGMYAGEGAGRTKELWDKARLSGRAVIFVDECDGLFARRGGMHTDAAIEEVTNAFLPAWDGLDSKGQIWLVGATNKRERIDQAIQDRFGEQIEIGLPDAAARLEILRLEIRKLESPIVVPEFAGATTSGFSGRNLSKVAAAVYRLAAQRGGQATDEMWQQVIGQSATSASDAVDPDARWDRLILPEHLLRRLRRVSEMLKHAEALREQGIDIPRAALLYGPPGTGKTQIARTLANESTLNFIAAGPSDIKGAHLGESGKMVRELFERARAKPTVLFIDEIEAGAPSRNSGRADQYTVEIVTELLTQTEGARATTGMVFLLAATNHPDMVDAALLSRFEERLEIPNPGPDERVRMIKAFLGKRRVDFDVDAVAKEVGARSEGFSGRDLMSLVRRASQQSAERAIDAGTAGQIVMTREDLLGQLDAAAGM